MNEPARPERIIATIELDNFCRLVSEESVARRFAFPELVREVVGGLANLYLAAAVRRRRSEVTVQTIRAFASRDVPMSIVSQEILNCSGLSRRASRILWRGMENILR